MKKKLLLVLVILFITLSSNIAYSQDDYVPPTIKLDSVKEVSSELNRIDIYASLYKGTDSIIEKGFEIKSKYGIDHFIIPIINENFDSIFRFFPEADYYWVIAYARTDSTIITSDTSYFSTIREALPKDYNEDIKSIKVYPTIINNYVNIISMEYPLDIFIIDILGRKVIKETINYNNQIDCSQLKCGVYNAIINTSDKRFVSIKLIKR